MTQNLHLFEPRLTLGEACAYAGVNPRKVTVWLQRDKINLGKVISSKRRLLSIWETCHLGIVDRLSSLATIDSAAGWSAAAMSELENRVRERPISVDHESQATIEWCQTLGLFVQDVAHTEVNGSPSINLTAAELALSKAAEAYARGAGSVAFIFVPIGLLLASIYERVAADYGTAHPKVVGSVAS